MTDTVELVLGNALCTVAPGLGGALLGFSVHGMDYLRAAHRAKLVTDAACFSLVPYCNRVAGGAIRASVKS